MRWQEIQPLLVALAIGLLLGLERERSHSRKLAAGSRSFALLSLAGAVAASFSQWAVLGGLVGAGALLGLAYVRTSEKDPGTTTDRNERVPSCSTGGVSEMTSFEIRNTRPARRLRSAVSVVVAAGLGALGPAGTAHADATDDAFIAALKAHGIVHESNQAAIAAGRLVCHQLDMGKSPEDIATDVMNSSGLDGENAGYFVAVAERAYCPRYADIPS